jgi:hypothetical protein
VKPNLTELLSELQRDLRLQDWRVQITYERDLTNSSGAPVHGLCAPMADGKYAQIWIRDPETPIGQADPSVEEILIHELVHLHFAPLAGATQAEVVAEEQAVWALSEALHTAKTSARRGLIARAMVARAVKQTAPGRATTRTRNMDPIQALIAAIRAALTAEDPKAQIEELLNQFDGAGAPGETPPAAAELAPEEEEQQRAQEPTEEPKREQAPRAARPVAVAQVGKFPGMVTRADFDRFKAEQHIEMHGKHLNPAQRAYAATITTYEGAKNYLKTHPALASAPAATATRNRAPVQGPRSGAGGDPNVAEVDRRMGLAPVSMQAIGRDAVTGRLTISNIAPAKVVAAVPQKVGG